MNKSFLQKSFLLGLQLFKIKDRPQTFPNKISNVKHFIYVLQSSNFWSFCHRNDIPENQESSS